ncbi:hypothetical protein DOM21_14430 [Bacteriovorax stolpii]|uniref:Uncharacterized protein n=1 Tax=Bacteriovorax stolpii TaxID=960 RepID=A0A2K9NPF8_BACTC|nr:hypothetical protein [Bacteriovorax stolpii]AUN97406.1 hypothetical protein C0V70_04625 [Bacteriovorax stolpii]QDK42624.1 hypothetical protein DOM21_14430 [Bacteriovorax stolpii]TDP52579.1 hypothetical protein C8D79_2345 [Bacteriovorax stolpii]
MNKAADKKQRQDEEEDHPDISHIPNDQPIPSRNPEKNSPEIPVDEPDIPGPKNVPMKEPNRKSRIRVLNIQ